jgi:hypothetical protein
MPFQQNLKKWDVRVMGCKGGDWVRLPQGHAKLGGFSSASELYRLCDRQIF